MPLRGTALLPTRTRINPRDPAGSEYYDPGQMAYVIKESGSARLIVATSFGENVDPTVRDPKYAGTEWDWSIGSYHEVRHDQTMKTVGFFHVVGAVRFSDMKVWGDVPAGRVPHWVFK